MNGGFTPLLNRRGASCAVLIASMAAAAWLYGRYGSKVTVTERGTFIGLLAAGANGLAVILLSLDANDYFEQSKAANMGRPETSWAGYPYADVISNNKQLTLSAL